ncbi:hypothetical protein DL96DRAFT_1459137 [Flagelloscypha sp. PMI_526]|nr:hypothetical protein DL96DRAFT_1459137 [Flagelloscypha sp. PMI_526]
MLESSSVPNAVAGSGVQRIFDCTTGQELNRYSDLWFEDGSVVCRADDTLFKVHMSQLSRHSVCFRDMFSMPQPIPSSRVPPVPLGDGQVDLYQLGCPVIILHDDPNDVASLFTALYDGPNFGDNGVEDFRVTAGILRLATKYIIDSLREKALAHLSKAWPDTLKGWDAREDRTRSRSASPIEEVSSFMYPSPIAVINLARQVHAPSLLASAFYDLSRYPFSQIFESSFEDSLVGVSTMSDSTLSPMDLQRLCLGKESSAHAITTLIQAMGQSQHVRQPQFSHGHTRRNSGVICISAAACRKDFSELVDLATQHYLFDREKGCSDPLYVAEELGQLKSAEFSECKACAISLEVWSSRERDRLWKLVPIWFRLESPSPQTNSPSPKLA